MGYVDPESYYYCQGCGCEVPYFEANYVTYFGSRTEHSGGFEANVVFCDDCHPGVHEVHVENFEDTGWGYYYGDTNWVLNPDVKLCKAIRKRLKVTGGNCPCVPQKDWSQDTVCPCKTFRTGFGCHCGLYVKYTED